MQHSNKIEYKPVSMNNTSSYRPSIPILADQFFNYSELNRNPAVKTSSQSTSHSPSYFPQKIYSPK